MLGSMISKIRKEKHITKVELAKRTKINIGHLTHIEKGAFACCRKLAKILIPVQTETIGEEVFQHCQKLKHIHVSQFVEHIGENAFEDIAEDAIIHVVAGSYAEQYAKDNNIPFVAE